MRAHLVIESGPNAGEVHSLDAEGVVVGRSMDCGIQLFDRRTSRQHLRIERRGKEHWLVDLGSKNCSAVNGVPVTEKLLQWGDEIRLGDTRMVYVSEIRPKARPAADSRAIRQTQTSVMERGPYEMVGSSPAMRQVFAVIEKIAGRDVTVLVLGESGTGKELVARAIHRNSPRAGGAFITVNCATIPRELADSELFGHERGAFTGAVVQRRGRFELASGGTLFLDEIAELSPETQARLLRVIEERKITRVGGEQAFDVDVRIVAASNRDLRELAAAGQFRQDLLFRLEVVRVDVPPLRDRLSDVPELAGFFLEHFSQSIGRRLDGLTPEAVKRLMAYSWPGNVRELRNCIERAVILGAGPRIEAQAIVLGSGASPAGEVETLAVVEKRHIERALAAVKGNKLRAAQLLDIPRSTLYNKLQEYGIV